MIGSDTSLARGATAPGRRVTILLALAGLIAAAAPAAGQSDPRLVEALRIAQEGASDSARGIVTRLLQQTTPTDTLYPQLLYTMGLISRSVEEMRRNYSRVAIEHTNSAWADDAVYRLGLLDFAAGDQAGATRNFERVRNDYPDSPLIPAASEWAARSYFEQRRPADACRWLTAGLAQAGEDVELRNRLEFLNGRCAPGAQQAAASDTAKPAPAPATRSGFAVQVAAVNTRAAADRTAADLKSAGFTPYVVEEGGLFKVRVGPYPDRPAAAQAAEQIRGRLRASPFVVKEP